MLQQLEQLSVTTDGRYATDAELRFFQDYLKTARLRFALYQKLQKVEMQLVEQVLAQIKMTRPDLLMMGNADMTAKWKRDTVRILRYAAAALLSDDSEVFRDRMLLWFQTIMRSFKSQKACEETYKIMQVVVRKMLTPEEAELVCPILEMSRTVLGEGDSPTANA